MHNSRARARRNSRRGTGSHSQPGREGLMATSTPPPYFPQNPLSPGDGGTARKMKTVLIGCAALSLILLVGVVVAIVYLLQWLL